MPSKKEPLTATMYMEDVTLFVTKVFIWIAMKNGVMAFQSTFYSLAQQLRCRTVHDLQEEKDGIVLLHP